MRLKKLFFLLIAEMLVLAPAAGCDGKEYLPIELVPEGVGMVAGIKVNEAMRNWDLYSQMDGNEGASEQFEEAREEFLEETGIDLSDVSEVVIFADVSSEEDMEYYGIIMTGNFGDEDLVDRIEAKSEMDFRTEKFADYTIYVDHDNDSAFVAISNKMIILGSEGAVKDCIDVASGEVYRLSGVVLDNYNSLGDVVMKLSMVVPNDAKESFAEVPDEAMVPVGMEAFSEIRTLGMAADMGTQSMTVIVNADFSSPGSAADAAEALETMIDFIAMMSTEQEMADMLGRIEISVRASRMYLTYEISLAEMAELGESLKDSMGMPAIPAMPPDIDSPGNLWELPEEEPDLD
jgi:hypothetical protein